MVYQRGVSVPSINEVRSRCPHVSLKSPRAESSSVSSSYWVGKQVRHEHEDGRGMSRLHRAPSEAQRHSGRGSQECRLRRHCPLERQPARWEPQPAQGKGQQPELAQPEQAQGELQLG